MAQKIYFADLTHTGVRINSNAFPLGVGCVMAHANSELKDLISSDLFKFPEGLNEALLKQTPDMLCMSNFCWNINLSYAFIKYVKKINPSVITVFGGPNFPIDEGERESFLKNHPCLDFYIKWDGEIAFVNLFRKLAEVDFDANLFKSNKTISENCCYVHEGEYLEGPDHRSLDLPVLPSPYLTGLFDEFFALNLQPYIEVTRGCPYACTFCNDGHESRNGVHRKLKHQVQEELEYIAVRAKNSVLGIADLNFAMYKEDLDTARTISSVIKKYDWPHQIETSMGKSQPERLIEAVDIINENKSGVIKLRSSVQSMDYDVLKLIKRKNMPIEKILDLNKAKGDNIQTEFFTELILALPGDSLEIHFQSLRTAIDSIGFNNIDIHQLILLKGSEMAEPKERAKFNFDVRHRVYVGCFGLYDVGHDKEVPIPEFEETVVGNDTLNFKEYLECRVMSLLVKIYVDDNSFNEVFSFLKGLQLSVFDLLIHLKNNFINKFSSLDGLVESFIEGTQKPLYKDLNYLKEYLSKEIIQKYISGEIGGNELINHKAWAFVNCSDDLHSCLEKSILSYLEISNRSTEANRKFVQDSIRFSQLRRLDLSNTEGVKEGSFSRDFIKIQVVQGQIPIESDSKEVEVQFYYDKNNLQRVQDILSSWGTDSLPKLGKLYQKANLNVLCRSVRFKEGDRHPSPEVALNR
jgi:radical SAM superfamily enzyme YgiQ (UPF0313 family)